ncbi:unnamed protein product [Moneuplotes crassus]|uniref:Uncharacterized protein n=1 Tax=Euplotes crassus TaxID=5936 RepID=A0AAD1XJI5_EUPCR|nr:unnamed protein product [Moneuplotes crassus]
MTQTTLNYTKNEIARFTLEECLDLFKTLTDPDSKPTITSRDFDPKMPQSVLKWKAGFLGISVLVTTYFMWTSGNKEEGKEQGVLESVGKGVGACLFTVLCNKVSIFEDPEEKERKTDLMLRAVRDRLKTCFNELNLKVANEESKASNLLTAADLYLSQEALKENFMKKIEGLEERLKLREQKDEEERKRVAQVESEVSRMRRESEELKQEVTSHLQTTSSTIRTHSQRGRYQEDPPQNDSNFHFQTQNPYF